MKSTAYAIYWFTKVPDDGVGGLVPETEERDLIPKLRLSAFKFERVVFEVRFPTAFLLWDRAGAIWKEASAAMADLKLVSAEPAKTTFRRGDNFEYVVELEAARIIAHRPPDLKLSEFTGASETLVELLTRHLEVSVFSRVGLRFLFFKEFEDRNLETSAVLATGLVRVPSQDLFSTEARPVTALDCGIRWEDKALGVRALLQHQDRQYSLEKPPGLELPVPAPPTTVAWRGLSFDIDFYTVGAVQAGQLSAGEWISQQTKLLKEDATVFFGAEGTP